MSSCLTILILTSLISLFRSNFHLLFAGNLAWSPKDNTYYHFLTINLDDRKEIRSIATQGRAQSSEFVTEYIVQYSDDGEGWKSYASSTGEPEVQFLFLAK